MKIFFKTIRIHQWTKNFLVFLPLLLSHQFTNIQYLSTLICCFFSISLMASSTYIVNDILDLESDQVHSVKKHRPIASGQIKTNTAITFSILLFLVSIAIALSTSMILFKLLIVYLIATLSYSYWLKKIVILDVLILAFLYTLRLLIGSWVIGIPISEWLFAFSVFLFCSLGFLKRTNEIINTKSQNTISNPRRGYQTSDLSLIQLFGVTTGVASILVFVLYINSSQVKLLYKINYWLWLIAPLFLYWMARMWLISSRGNMHEDPVVFAMEDKVGYIIFVLIMICMILAKIGFVPL